MSTPASLAMNSVSHDPALTMNSRQSARTPGSCGGDKSAESRHREQLSTRYHTADATRDGGENTHTHTTAKMKKMKKKKKENKKRRQNETEYARHGHSQLQGSYEV